MAVSTVKATVNGSTYTLTLNASTGKYEATITAPTTSSYPLSGHYYPISIEATDDAGNTKTIDANDATFGTELQLVVKEKVAPVITISSPTAGAYITNNKPEITWTVTDDDSGVDPDTITITIDGTKYTSGITKTATSDGYSCSYTVSSALADGSHTVSIEASDYDGNAATAKSVTFTVDTVPPSLSVTSPTDGYVSAVATVTVAGTAGDVTSTPVTVTVSVNGTSKEVTVGSDGSFSTEVTLSSGENTIVVTVVDSAGQTASVTRTVTFDNNAPEFISVSVTPNPVDAGSTYIISVEVVDD